MERALIIGASGGIGAALARRLTARGTQVTALSRSADGLDVTQEDSIREALGRLEPGLDLVICATGKLEGAGQGPEKAFSRLTAAAMADQYATNCIGPALVLKHAMALLPRDRRAVFAALSARVGSIGDNGLGGWMSYRAAKAGLNQVVRCGAIELARTHPQALCLALHPGTVETPFTEGFTGRDKHSPDTAADHLLEVIAGLGPEDSGSFHDWRGTPVPW
ncbi:SDR family NAD(P)-dependent oxidoreductase [Pseudooceanicola sp. HF7]|uniref:SDR family NAD(P)-dependent oxidoreductase n=1 Tax=Pseudooceanicola sp. HF7 TaxID=2721560 RepID=UPI0014300685|nr:SDR family NAD(P)-dependent oxidoreductase [Pseudooceanicola sp. HF7]NIZ10268.1 SDR family NAD(P)-dependent oxidoreductase [Pseudooceanicola sp. HF7]